MTKRDIARYMYGEPIQYTPGVPDALTDQERYSNLGYVLLGLVVEQVTGQTFHIYLRQAALTPIGHPNDVLVGNTLRSGRYPTEVPYHDAKVDTTARAPWSDALVPAVYGHFLVAQTDSSGGLVATAPAVTALLNRHAAWGVGPGVPGASRSGLMPGTRSYASASRVGKDWAIMFNTTATRPTAPTTSSGPACSAGWKPRSAPYPVHPARQAVDRRRARPPEVHRGGRRVGVASVPI